MPVCKICGKYIPEKDPKPQPKTWDEFIEAWNSIGCTSFVYCYECIKKYNMLKESED